MAEKLNALILNEGTGRITLPVGGTGFFTIELTPPTGVTLDTATDKAVFGIGSIAEKPASNVFHYESIFRKTYPISKNGDTYTVLVELTNAETRAFMPGEYVWDITVITGADIVNGQAVANDAGDNVYPVYATEGNPPKFIVKGAVPIV